MRETLLQAVLSLLDQIESPVILHGEAAQYPSEQITQLTSDGILSEAPNATEIPRPARFGPGPDLVVRKTARGIEGVANKEDYFPPVPLSDDDIRQYEVSVRHFVEKIRRDSGIEGNGYRNDRGLTFVGQKAVTGVGIADVYLSLPNSSEDAVMARCRRLVGIASERPVALLTPSVVDFSGEDRRIFDRIVTLSLMTAASEGHLKVNWDEAFGSATPAGGVPALASPAGPDLERMIQGKAHVDVRKASRYLSLTDDHVRRLARTAQFETRGDDAQVLDVPGCQLRNIRNRDVTGGHRRASSKRPKAGISFLASRSVSVYTRPPSGGRLNPRPSDRSMRGGQHQRHAQLLRRRIESG